MRSLIFTVVVCLIYFMQFVEITLAKPNTTIPDFRIHFNETGMNFVKDIKFELYTRENKNVAQQLFVNDKRVLKKSSFRTRRPTKFIAHGWSNTGKTEAILQTKNGLLHHDDYNVIVIDWSVYSDKNFRPGVYSYDEDQTIYKRAASRVKSIGKYVSKMIKFLRSEGSDVKQMSLVGHSMGAHIVGIAGYYIFPKVGHIIGLDPSRPGFQKHAPTNRLSEEDADHVEVVHTNAFNLGFQYHLGDVDYWPNGGRYQPGCPANFPNTCSHLRALDYYAESLMRPKSWLTVQCESPEKFDAGECVGNLVEPFPQWSPVSLKTKGDFLLRTRAKSSYGLGKEGIKPANESSEKKEKDHFELYEVEVFENF